MKERKKERGLRLRRGSFFFPSKETERKAAALLFSPSFSFLPGQCHRRSPNIENIDIVIRKGSMRARESEKCGHTGKGVAIEKNLRRRL